MMDVKRMEIGELIDKAVKFKEESDFAKEVYSELLGEITMRGMAYFDDTNKKYFSVAGKAGQAEIMFKQKLEIDDATCIRAIIGKAKADKYIEDVRVIKYEAKGKFKEALIAVYTGEYDRGYDIIKILVGMGKPETEAKQIAKLIKGDYRKDKDLLSSYGLIAENEELYAIKLAKSYENIVRFLGDDFEQVAVQIKKAIFVEESVSAGISKL